MIQVMAMLCQDCKKREAQVHLTQIVNNEKLSLSLCKECAAARGFHSPLDNVPFPLAEILSGLAGPGPQPKNTEPVVDITCGTCGLTFDEFTRQGRFGCGDCYAAFRVRLEPIMRKIHGASLHRGRNPEYARIDQDTAQSIKEEERLQSELSQAIDDEDFERAAELRDKLKSVRLKLTVEEASKG
jgi:protein arginine kinase activator